MTQILTGKKLVSTLVITAAFSLVACSKSDIKESPSLNPINSYFPGEIKAPIGSQCFPGAYYRKAVSSKDTWLGITGKVVLPQISFDPNRTNPSKPGQYLDNPSVYVGGNANGQETDIGLTWEVIRDANGNVTPDRRAFRPFLRRTGFAPTGQLASYENAPASPEFYWYPGDTIEISLKMISNGVLMLRIAGANKVYEKSFSCDGYTQGSAVEFKRVNAIDQVANEGKPAQPTKTAVKNSKWLYTSLYRMFEGQEVKAPMHSGRFTDMRCPDLKFFTITASGEELNVGSESVSIDGGR